MCLMSLCLMMPTLSSALRLPMRPPQMNSMGRWRPSRCISPANTSRGPGQEHLTPPFPLRYLLGLAEANVVRSSSSGGNYPANCIRRSGGQFIRPDRQMARSRGLSGLLPPPRSQSRRPKRSLLRVHDRVAGKTGLHDPLLHRPSRRGLVSMAHPQQAGRRFPFLLGEAWGRRKPPARFRQRTRQPRGALASRMDLPNRMPSVSAKISQGFNQQMSADQALPGEITDLLHRWGEGDSAALSSIASVTYDDLRSIAHGYLQRENRAHTLQATGLVNELYLRLTQQRGARLTDRRHFAWVDASGSDMLALDQALAELEALDERKVDRAS